MKKKYLDLNGIAPKLILINALLFCPFIILSLLPGLPDRKIFNGIKTVSLVCSAVLFSIVILLIIYEQIQDRWFRSGSKEAHWIKLKNGLFECSGCGFRQKQEDAKTCSSCGREFGGG